MRTVQGKGEEKNGEDGGEGKKDEGAYVGGFEERAVAASGARSAPSRGRYTPHCTLSARQCAEDRTPLGRGLAERGMWVCGETGVVPDSEINTRLNLRLPPRLLPSSGQKPRGPELPSECRRPASLAPAEREETQHPRTPTHPPEPRLKSGGLCCTDCLFPPLPFKSSHTRKRSTRPRRCPLCVV